MRRTALTFPQVAFSLGIFVGGAALLFPYLFKARENGRPPITCQSNLKKIQIAALMYMQDYDNDKYPPLATKKYGWTNLLLTYSREPRCFQCSDDRLSTTKSSLLTTSIIGI